MTAIVPLLTPSCARARESGLPAGFQSKAQLCNGSAARAATLRVTMSLLRIGARGPPSYEFRPCTTTAARSSPAWKNLWSASSVRAAGIRPAASAIIPSSEMIAYASICIGIDGQRARPARAARTSGAMWGRISSMWLTLMWSMSLNASSGHHSHARHYFWRHAIVAQYIGKIPQPTGFPLHDKLPQCKACFLQQALAVPFRRIHLSERRKRQLECLSEPAQTCGLLLRKFAIKRGVRQAQHFSVAAFSSTDL